MQTIFVPTSGMNYHDENAAYHADASRISKSGLDLINKSPAHYWDKYLNPNGGARKQTAALTTGSAIHSIILEPEQFSDRFVLDPKLDRRTNAGKAAWDEFVKREAGKLIITQSDYDLGMIFAEKVRKHPVAAWLLSKGKAERINGWTDPETGAPCKSKPDWDNTVEGWIADLKTTEDASPEGFGRSAANYRYEVQGAYYWDGYFYTHGAQKEGFAFIALEKTPPYAIAVYYLTSAQRELGRERYLANLRTYAECLKTGVWPEYPVKAKPLELPKYATILKTL